MIGRAVAAARPHARAGGERGQSMVELTMVALPLLVILFGIVEFGLIMFDKVTVVNDAREAARLAAVNDPSGKTLSADAPSGATLSFTCTTDPASGNPAGQFNVGDKVTAHVTYQYTFAIPLIGSIVGGPLDLSSNATMTLEGQPTNYC
jgi:Flp pilus assembly protein TadG